MSNLSQKPVDLIPDGKIHVVSLKMQSDLYRWVVHEATKRRTTVSYVLRDLVNSAMIAQKENSND